MRRPIWLLAVLVCGGRVGGADWIAYVGAYTDADNKGIHAYRFSDTSGTLTDLGVAAETVNPSWLAVSPDHRFLYAANEIQVFNGASAGSISAFSIGPSGALKPLNVVSSRGAGPCHIALDKEGKWLFAANYNGGSVAAFPVHDDGSLGEAAAFIQHKGSSINPQRQAGPHAHSVNPSPDNRYLLVSDLGLDEILIYHLDAANMLKPGYPPFTKIAPASGPRHMAFAPGGRFVYSINELASTVTAFEYKSETGHPNELQTISTLPQGYNAPNSAAEIAVHPGGKFLYASNRGHDSIAIFQIDPEKGTLTAIGNVPTQGKTPRSFAIDPSGKFLLAANQDSGSIVEFRVDASTGALTPSGVTASLASPAAIVFVPVN